MKGRTHWRCVCFCIAVEIWCTWALYAMHRMIKSPTVAAFTSHYIWHECFVLYLQFETYEPDDRIFHVKYCIFAVFVVVLVFLLLFSVSFIFCYPHLLLHVRPFVILFRSYFCFFSSLFWILFPFHTTVLCVWVRHLFFVIMPGAAAAASNRAAWWLCMLWPTHLLPSPRYFHFCFPFDSCCRLLDSVLFTINSFSHSLTQHCMCDHMCWKRTTWTHTNFFCFQCFGLVWFLWGLLVVCVASFVSFFFVLFVLFISIQCKYHTRCVRTARSHNRREKNGRYEFECVR